MTTTHPTAASTSLDPKLRELLIEEHQRLALPRLRRLWEYYRNDPDPQPDTAHARQYRMAQEQGLPRRLRSSAAVPREVVIENDIAWRVHTLVDFMFGKPVALQSCAAHPEQAALIQLLLNRIFELNGGLSFFQDMALLGSIYGYADVLLRVTPQRSATRTADDRTSLIAQAERFVLETLEGPRVVPVINPQDYRKLDALIVHYRQMLNEPQQDHFLSRLHRRVTGSNSAGGRRATIQCTQVWTRDAYSSYRARPNSDGKRQLVEQSVNRLGRIPVVHIQNLPQPYFYEGLSEVEPLIPLQDELNTRLSDRANRVTFQSFKMYLGKHIDKFTQRPVGPGQMWATDHPDASIEEFGGDAACPSEQSHINEIREAMDKTSAVTAVAAGLLRNKVGNLTSENALRIVMMGLLAKTERKRVTYGQGIQRLCELILHAADVYGILPNRPCDRAIRLDWPSPLPESESQRLRDAQIKLELGVPRKQVLTELGYGDCAEAH